MAYKNTQTTFTQSENTNALLRSIRNKTPLTQEEEMEVFARHLAGENIANILVERNILLIIQHAKQFARQSEDIDDLIQAGVMGIIDALDHFDTNRNIRFITFAVHYIDYHIRRELEQMTPVKACTDGNLAAAVKEISTRYFKEHDMEISKQELIEILEEEYDIKVKNINAVTKMSFKSLDLTYGEGDDEMSYIDSAEISEHSATCNDYENVIEDDHRKTMVNALLNKLSGTKNGERDVKIVCMVYGLNGFPEMEYPEIAERISIDYGKKISAERIRQIAIEAVQKMK